MAYLAAAVDAILALQDRNSNSSLLLRSLRKIVTDLTKANRGKPSFSISASRLCSAIEAGLRSGPLVNVKALGGRGRNGNGPGDPVGRLLRVLLLRVRAFCKGSPVRKASTSKRKAATTRRMSHKKTLAIKRKAAAVTKRPANGTAKSAKKRVTAAAAGMPRANKSRTSVTTKSTTARKKVAGKKSPATKKKVAVRRKKTANKAKTVSTPRKTPKKRVAEK